MARDQQHTAAWLAEAALPLSPSLRDRDQTGKESERERKNMRSSEGGRLTDRGDNVKVESPTELEGQENMMKGRKVFMFERQILMIYACL